MRPTRLTASASTSPDALANFSRLTEVEAWGVDAVPPPPDTEAPTDPTGLNATAVSASQIDLSWTASTDNVGVTAYQVYRDSSLIATLGNVTSYSDTGLTASTLYSYTVAACDAASNCSNQSSPASVTTQAANASSNVALASAGGVASASSTINSNYPVSALIDNLRSGAGLTSGAWNGWNDGTKSVYPDWVQIDFNGSKTIDHVVVYTVQDNYSSSVGTERHDDIQPVWRSRLHGAGLERVGLGDAGDGHGQQPGEADGELCGLHD